MDSGAADLSILAKAILLMLQVVLCLSMTCGVVKDKSFIVSS
jgi:hypothetical protein